MVGAHGGRNMVCVSMFMLIVFCFLLIFEWGVINFKKPPNIGQHFSVFGMWQAVCQKLPYVLFHLILWENCQHIFHCIIINAFLGFSKCGLYHLVQTDFPLSLSPLQQLNMFLAILCAVLIYASFFPPPSMHYVLFPSKSYHCSCYLFKTLWSIHVGCDLCGTFFK